MNLGMLKSPAAKKYIPVAIILALVVFVTGRMSGYLIAQGSYGTELANLTSQYAELNESYNSCLTESEVKGKQIASLQEEKADLQNDKTSLINTLSSVNINLGSCNTELSDAKSSITAKDSQITSLTQQKDSLNQSYNAVVASSAKAICCVKKIFDSSLSAYYIQNNMIVCTNDTSRTLFAC